MTFDQCAINFILDARTLVTTMVYLFGLILIKVTAKQKESNGLFHHQNRSTVTSECDPDDIENLKKNYGMA